MQEVVPFIVSLGHQEEIIRFCSGLEEQTGLDYFVVYVLFNNGKKFVISNFFPVLSAYYQDGYFRQDYSTQEELISDRSYYICDETPSVSNEFAQILENKFSIYRTFNTIRHSQECSFVFGGAKKSKVDNPHKFYTQSKQDFDQFCTHFISNANLLIKQYNPEYKHSLILNDEIYLKKIVQQKQNPKSLTEREKECLIWAAEGKTAEETGMILNISKETIQKHRRSIIQKLDCPNLCSAIFKAITEGSLGNLCQYPNKNNFQLKANYMWQYNNVVR